MDLSQMNCVICGSLTEAAHAIWPVQIAACRRCGLITRGAGQSREQIKSFFEEQYLVDEGMIEQEFGLWRRDTLRREAQIILQQRDRGRILDVGCAGGEFLTPFLDAGWDCTGLEPSRLAVERARLAKLKLVQGTLEDFDCPPASFEVISYLDALYFSPNPLDDLRRIHRLLTPGGLLMVEIPGLTYRILRNYGPLSLLINRRWSHLHSPAEHLHYFSDRAMRSLLQEAGFSLFGIYLEQAPIKGGRMQRRLNQAHYFVAQWLWRLSGKRLNLAAKVVYLCARTAPANGSGSENQLSG